MTGVRRPGYRRRGCRCWRIGGGKSVWYDRLGGWRLDADVNVSAPRRPLARLSVSIPLTRAQAAGLLHAEGATDE